jgi:peptidylprolyl isomerase
MIHYKPILALIIGCVVLVGGLSYWMGIDTTPELELDTTAEEITAPLAPEALEAYQVETSNDMNPIAVLETNKGVIEIELFEDTMPITAGNFKKLVSEGFYDGIKFHRVIENFMIQSGDPITKTTEVLRYGTGGPGYAIADEHVAGPLLTNVRGTIAMANSGPNSGGSQFFINLVDNQNLDFNVPDMNNSAHPVFGRVVAGMDIVDAIGSVATNNRDLPVEDIVIVKATIK